MELTLPPKGNYELCDNLVYDSFIADGCKRPNCQKPHEAIDIQKLPLPNQYKLKRCSNSKCGAAALRCFHHHKGEEFFASGRRNELYVLHYVNNRVVHKFSQPTDSEGKAYFKKLVDTLQTKRMDVISAMKKLNFRDLGFSSPAMGSAASAAAGAGAGATGAVETKSPASTYAKKVMCYALTCTCNQAHSREELRPRVFESLAELQIHNFKLASNDQIELYHRRQLVSIFERGTTEQVQRNFDYVLHQLKAIVTSQPKKTSRRSGRGSGITTRHGQASAAAAMSPVAAVSPAPEAVYSPYAPAGAGSPAMPMPYTPSPSGFVPGYYYVSPDGCMYACPQTPMYYSPAAAPMPTPGPLPDGSYGTHMYVPPLNGQSNAYTDYHSATG